MDRVEFVEKLERKFPSGELSLFPNTDNSLSVSVEIDDVSAYLIVPVDFQLIENEKKSMDEVNEIVKFLTNFSKSLKRYVRSLKINSL